MREEFEKQLTQQWNIHDPKLFELNIKGNYKISAVDREWDYYKLYVAANELKSKILKLFSNMLDKLKSIVI